MKSKSWESAALDDSFDLYRVKELTSKEAEKL
jgi:hypothetical protein